MIVLPLYDISDLPAQLITEVIAQVQQQFIRLIRILDNITYVVLSRHFFSVSVSFSAVISLRRSLIAFPSV